jgi:hypothetical protein
MPTQIPIPIQRSWLAEAREALTLSLLAAAINGVVFIVIVWAYS